MKKGCDHDAAFASRGDVLGDAVGREVLRDIAGVVFESGGGLGGELGHSSVALEDGADSCESSLWAMRESDKGV